jgi:hypothetical protein
MMTGKGKYLWAEPKHTVWEVTTPHDSVWQLKCKENIDIRQSHDFQFNLLKDRYCYVKTKEEKETQEKSASGTPEQETCFEEGLSQEES